MFAEDCCGHEQSWKMKRMFAGDWWPSGASSSGTQSQSPAESVLTLYHQIHEQIVEVTYNLGVLVAFHPDA